MGDDVNSGDGGLHNPDPESPVNPRQFGHGEHDNQPTETVDNQQPGSRTPRELQPTDPVDQVQPGDPHCTPLSTGIANPHQDALVQAIMSKQPEIALELIRQLNKHTLHNKFEGDWGYLHFAAHCGMQPAIEALIAQGLRMDQEAEYHQTPAALLAAYNKEHPDAKVTNPSLAQPPQPGASIQL